MLSLQDMKLCKITFPFMFVIQVWATPGLHLVGYGNIGILKGFLSST